MDTPPHPRILVRPGAGGSAIGEGGVQGEGAGGSLAGRLGHALQQHRVERLVHGVTETNRRRCWRGVEVMRAKLHHRAPFEERLAGEEQVADRAERVDVAAPVDLVGRGARHAR